MSRRFLCWLGLHRWQILYEPPHHRDQGAYRKAIFCIFCSREHPRKPGDLNGTEPGPAPFTMRENP